MSRMAAFTDGHRGSDQLVNTVISLPVQRRTLALDLTLRDAAAAASRRRLHAGDVARYGKPGTVRLSTGPTRSPTPRRRSPGQRRQGVRPRVLRAPIQGHDIADYPRLLSRAGFTVRKRNAGRAWLGDLHLDTSGGARVAGLVAPTWPIYASGLDQDDELQQIDGHRINNDGDVAAALARRKPGDTIQIAFVDRTGSARTARVTLAEDPHMEVVPAEHGGTLTAAQKTFRDHWLGAK
jgi:hypothetical protein